MDLAWRLENLVVCPSEKGDSVVAGRRALLHQVRPTVSGSCRGSASGDERVRMAAQPQALAANYADETVERLHMDYYRRQAETKEHACETNGAIRDAVDFVVTRLGIGVDLASGHGGGFIAPIVRRMSFDSILLATDACLPVIEN